LNTCLILAGHEGFSFIW